jgi:hypothetical protein
MSLQELALQSREPPVSPPPQAGKTGVTGAARFALYGVVLGNLSNALCDDGPELPGGKAISPWSHSPASVIPTTGSSDTFSRSASQVLLAPPPVKAPRKYADDILHFFDRGSRAQGTGTICKSCKSPPYVAVIY